MIVIFDKTYLKELYESGATSGKKHRFQPNIVKRYQKRINTLKDAPNPNVLYQLKSLHFEALTGDKNGSYSIRVNDQYRIEFGIDYDGQEANVIVCNIEELSNHYD